MERVFTPAGCDLFDQVASPVTRGGGRLMGDGGGRPLGLMGAGGGWSD